MAFTWLLHVQHVMAIHHCTSVPVVADQQALPTAGGCTACLLFEGWQFCTQTSRVEIKESTLNGGDFSGTALGQAKDSTWCRVLGQAKDSTWCKILGQAKDSTQCRVLGQADHDS